MKQPSIAIVGGGNVATAMSQAFDSAHVAMLPSRTVDHDAIADFDVVILAVADDAIAEVAGAIGSVKNIIAHTSGSVPMQALESCKAKGYGVFYPLQTFTKGREVNFAEIPMLIEGSNEDTTLALMALASSISINVRRADSSQRAALHVAAVFACNFANAMWTVGSQLIEKADLPFEIMSPLLHETLDKAIEMTPVKAQTGPAKRGDIQVIQKHISSLPDNLADIYKAISKLIYEQNRL